MAAARRLVVDFVNGMCATRHRAATALVLVAYMLGPVSYAADKASAPPATQTQSQYIIGPGDTIQIFVWQNPDLSTVVPVRPDGRVSTPLVEDMVAVGKTPTQLARDIEVRLAEYVRSPQVNVIVTNPANVFNQVKVIGQVKAPQPVPYREGMMVLDLIQSVGGLSEFAAGNRARLTRKDENGKEISIRVRLNDLLIDGKISENIPVKPGDVLFVPEALF